MELTRGLIICYSVLLIITGTIGEESGETCSTDTRSMDKVETCVYLNGESKNDMVWIGKYCDGLAEQVPYDEYFPTTIKFGAAIACDQNNECTCPTLEDPQACCTATFQHICVAQLISGDEYIDFLCCTKGKGFDKCVDDYNLGDKLNDCLSNEGAGGPRDIALQNAQELTNKGVDTTKNSEPYFIIGGTFNACVNRNVYEYWLETLCALIKPDISKNIQACTAALQNVTVT